MNGSEFGARAFKAASNSASVFKVCRGTSWLDSVGRSGFTRGPLLGSCVGRRPFAYGDRPMFRFDFSRTSLHASALLSLMVAACSITATDKDSDASAGAGGSGV